jgi:hypothetical protein
MPCTKPDEKESTTLPFICQLAKRGILGREMSFVHAAKQFHLSPDLPVTAVVAPVDHVPTPKPKLGETSPRSRSGDRRPFLDGMKDWKPL